MRHSIIGLTLMAATATVTVARANAETFVLDTGEVVEGSVVRAVGNTVSIKLAGVGMRQIPVADIRRVEIGLQEGPAIKGRLFAWSRDVYLLDTALGLVTIRDGKVLGSDTGSSTLAATPRSQNEGPDLKTMFRLFLAEFEIDATKLIESQNEEIFQQFLAWMKKRQREKIQ